MSTPAAEPSEGWTTDSHWVADGDGHVTRDIFMAPAFRHDPDGWHTIDPTIHSTADPAVPASAAGAVRPVRFGRDAAHVLAIQLDDGPVTLSASQLQIGAPHMGQGNTVTYSNVADATDLRYSVGVRGVKEEVVLSSPVAPDTFSFFLSDPKGQLGQVHALAPNGPFIFDRPVAPQAFLEIGQAFAYEQSHVQYDPRSAHVSVVRSGDGWQITESVDQRWLVGRHYPIILDPSVYVQLTIAGTYNSSQIIDYSIRADFGNGGCQNSCTGGPGQSLLDMGSVSSTSGGTFYNYYERVLAHYDLSSIPAGSSVSSGLANWWDADCDGGAIGAPCPGLQPVEWHRYNSAFPTTGTNMNTVLNNTDTGTTLASLSACSPASYNSPCLMQYNLTGEVVRWVNGTDPNNGLVAKLYCCEGANEGGPVWYASYYSPNSGIAKYPALIVTYSPPPSAPATVSATANSDASATVTWGAASTQGGDAITGYTVTTYTSSGGLVGSTTVCGTCTTTKVTGLAPGTSYYFTVYASNDWTNGPSAQSNTVTAYVLPLISKTADFTGAYMVPGQGTNFHVKVSSPSGTTPLATLKDVLPSGFAFANSTIGSVHISSSVAGVPTTCAAPTCTLTDSTLTLTFSPALNLTSSDYVQVDYPTVVQDTGRGCLSEVNTATGTNQYGSSVGSLAIATCESGLGFENYWRYVTRSLGSQGKAAINVASGNLVVQQDDFTPVQAHGRLALVLRRTYNSGDTAVATLPGTLGTGWQFNVSETDDVVGDVAGASGIYLPNASTTVGNPFAITLVDRDGTRHVYQPNALSTAVDVQSLPALSGPVSDVSGPLTTLYPLDLTLAQSSASYQPKYPYSRLCVDQTYTPPAGVHMWMWRYVAVEPGVTGSVCSPLTGTTATIAGYGAETTDRIRYEFSADGHLLAMADGAGNKLIYQYGTAASNQAVTVTPPYPDAAAFSVPISVTEPATGRAFTFSPMWTSGQITGFTVTDPAGRQTAYKLDGQYPTAHLTEVDNPDGSKLHYVYGSGCATSYGASTGAAVNQMCGETDLRSNTTYFTYTATSSDGYSYPQLPRANGITDRRESGITSPSNRQYTTQFSYYENPNGIPFATADRAGERERFLGIDGYGRVAEIDEGATSDQYIGVTKLTWDGTTDYQTGQLTYCRQPDSARDNDLCHIVRQNNGFTAPDENTSYTYADEGQLLVTYRCLGSASANPTALPPCPTTLDTTAGYGEEYFESSNTVTTFSDTDAGYSATTGHAAVTSTARGGATPNRVDGLVVFVVIQKTQDVPPRGNAMPPAGQTSQQQITKYATTYQVDATTSSAPSTPPNTYVCQMTGSSTNTGLVCEADGPAYDSSGKSAVTHYEYETHGQRAIMWTPLAPINNALYSYTYYPDPSASTDNTQRYDLSGHTPSGGWLKTITDPKVGMVAYAYDAAGNRVRVWDRDGTQGYPDYFFPGTASGGAGPNGDVPPCTFSETRYSAGSSYGQCPGAVSASAYLNPWRYVLFARDPLGDATTYQVDADGNRVLSRPPRGNPSGSPSVTTYDVSSAYDANDNVTCTVMPVEAAGGSCANPPAASTTYAYDAFNNRTSVKDPRGHYTVDLYDSVNRIIQHWWSRGAMPSSSSLVPAGCHQAGTQNGDPSQFGSGTSAPMICKTATKYDAVDNVIDAWDGNAEMTEYTYDSVHRKTSQAMPRDSGVTETTAWVYDPDGHVTDMCPPNEFGTGGSGQCGSQAPFSVHTAYDASGRPSSTTTYRAAGSADMTSMAYDADGNMVSKTDANGHVWQYTYNALDRKVSETHPRAGTTGYTTYYDYDASGALASEIQPGSLNVGSGGPNLVVDGTTATNSSDGQAHPQSNPYIISQLGAQYSSITLQNGGWISTNPWNGSAGGELVVSVQGLVTVCSNCGITVAGLGQAGGAGQTAVVAAAQGVGPGGGQPSGLGTTTPSGGGGAGHLNAGGAGAGPAGGAGGNSYGAWTLSDTGSPSIALGSGGGGGGGQAAFVGGSGGAGGGFIHITAETIDVEGVVTASGAAGTAGTSGPLGTGSGGGGGGSGGSLWLTAELVKVPGHVSSMGGAAGSGAATGGYGSDGIVRIDADYLDYGGPAINPYVAWRTWVGRVTAYSYDAAHRRYDTVTGADDPSARNARLPSSDGGKNVRTRSFYDADGHEVARLSSSAFLRAGPGQTDSMFYPDPMFMTRVDYDADGRPTAMYVPRYDNTDDGAAYADTGVSSTQASQCTTSQRPQSIAGVPSYWSGVGLCVTSVQYDAAANLSQVTLPTESQGANRVLRYVYTDDNLLATLDSPSANSSQSSPAGCVLPGGTPPGTRADRCYVYDGDGKPIQATDPNGHVTSTSYYFDELVRQVVHQPGATAHTWSYGYDGNGNPTTVTDGAGATTTTAYYYDNLVQSVTDGAGDRTSYTYDPVGNPIQVMSPSANACDVNNCKSGGSGTPTTYCYTQDNLVAFSWQPVAVDGSQQRQTAYTYDRGGRKLSQLKQLVGAPTPGACSALSGAASPTDSFAYYDDDRLSTQTETSADGASTYDTISETYTPEGQLASSADSQAGSTVTATYYPDGLARTVNDGNFTTQYDYDGLRSVVGRQDVGGNTYTTTYQYGDAEVPTSMTSAGTQNGTTQLTYDVPGRPATQTDPNGVVTQWTFNADDTVGSLAVGPSGSLADWTYAYDADYRQTSQGYSGAAASGGSPVTATFCYAYDGAGRLIQAVEASPCPSTPTTTIVRDHDGNPKSTKNIATGATTSMTYGPDDRITQNTTLGTTYSYNVQGDLLSDGCYQYSYLASFDRMDSAAPVSPAPAQCGFGNSPPPLTTYTYDGLDRLATHRENAAGAGPTHQHYDGLSTSVAVETPYAAPALVYEIDPGGHPRAVTQESSSPSTQFLATDGHGNVTTAVNSSQAVACTVRVDPFGGPVSPLSATNPCSSGSTLDDLFFHGARRDVFTGDYQFGSRVYDPSKQTFLTPDNFRIGPPSATTALQTDPLTENTYNYVNGDPVNLDDPNGHNPCSTEGYDIGGASGCTAEENAFAAASDRGASGPAAKASAKRVATRDIERWYGSLKGPGGLGLTDLNDPYYGGQEAELLPFSFTPSQGYGTDWGDLFIESQKACALVKAACSLGDNRGASATPEPTHSRAYFFLDFETGHGYVRVNPTCNDTHSQCFSPDPRNTVDVSTAGYSVEVKSALYNSQYQKFPVRSFPIRNDWTFSPDADSHHVTFAGSGSGYPSFELYQDVDKHQQTVLIAHGAPTPDWLLPLPLFDRTYIDPIALDTAGERFGQAEDRNGPGVESQGCTQPLGGSGTGYCVSGSYAGG